MAAGIRQSTLINDGVINPQGREMHVAGQSLTDLVRRVAPTLRQPTCQVSCIGHNLHYPHILCNAERANMFAGPVDHHHLARGYRQGIARLNAVLKTVRLPLPGQAGACAHLRKLLSSDFIVIRAAV